MRNGATHDFQKLVDLETGEVSRELFVNREIFEAELDRVFARAWLLIGHESQIPNPDDYVVSRMGLDSVILTRNRQDEILVFLNSCPHRGMRVCRYDSGNAKVFTCPYHGWSFSTDRERVSRPGALAGVPRFKDGYDGRLDRDRWGLVPCPRVEIYKGTIWASWDEHAPPLEDYLGDMRLYLDTALDHRDGRSGGSVVLGGVQKWRLKANWKICAENFIGDLYHNISHQSADLARIGPGGNRGRRDRLTARVAIGFPALGHGLLGYPPFFEEPEHVPSWVDLPEVEAYFREVHEARVRNLGDRMRVGMSVGTIFPNMSFHANQPRTILLAHPIGPTEMEMWRFYLVDEDAPEAVKSALRHYYLRYSGPGGMVESDDMENWSYATAASEGAVARRHAYNYQLGLGRERPVEGLVGAVESGSFSEANARIFYGRWRQFMQGDPWSGAGSGVEAMDKVRGMARHGHGD